MSTDEDDEENGDDPGDANVGGGTKKPRAKKPKPDRSAKRVPAIRVRRTKGKKAKPA
jgi:hypothetical protein